MRIWLLWMLLGASTAAPAAVVGDDEAWIENYMSQPGRSAGPEEVRRGYRVAWNDLGKFIEIPVKVTTRAGVVHRGYIERVDAGQMVLRSQLHGGFAQLKLSAGQVRSTELE